MKELTVEEVVQELEKRRGLAVPIVTIQRQLQRGRIKGARKIGPKSRGIWLIPEKSVDLIVLRPWGPGRKKTPEPVGGDEG